MLGPGLGLGLKLELGLGTRASTGVRGRARARARARTRAREGLHGESRAAVRRQGWTGTGTLWGTRGRVPGLWRYAHFRCRF